MHESEAFAVLNSIPYLGPTKIRLLVEKYASALNALEINVEQLANIPSFERVLPHWSQWSKNPLWRKDLALAEKFEVQLIPFTNTLFPKSLLKIPDPPVLLYVQGEIKPQDQQSIAVVGTRHASIYGNEMAHQTSNDLASQGFTIISGLARGIDTAAHQGALKSGRTIAVIGSGLANIYPPENRPLAQEIACKGAVISEFSMATPPDRQNFPQRNRIVSGMSLGTLLIEAPIKSGAMITMDRAFTQKRRLFALPGRADNDQFRGNHLLIKNGKASLVENASDISCHFDTLFPISSIKREKVYMPQLDKQELAILGIMPQEEIGIDALVSLTNLPINQLHATLMGLIFKKIVKEFPGKLYKKITIPNK